MSNTIKCPYFICNCLRQNCTAFSAFTTEKFLNLDDERIGITKIKQLYAEYGLKYLQDNLVREFRIWEECIKLAKVIDDRTERDHHIPAYIYE